MNKLQRHLRTVSDDRLSDTAVEMDACERARIAVDITKRALLDGAITANEALEILEAQQAVEDSASMSMAECGALIAWLVGEDGGRELRPEAAEEAQLVYRQAMRQQGQQALF